MAKLKNTVNKDELLADIKALESATTDEEVDAIMAKYDAALNEMDAEAAKPAKKSATKKEEPAKTEEPAKKETKKATTKKESAPTEEAPAKPAKKTAAKKESAPTAEEATEEPAKKGRTYNGKYEVFQVADGFSYHLKASNGEILVTSETYTTREGVLKAIDAVKRNLETGEVRIFADKRGKFKFKLISKNYRVLVISSTYGVEKSAIRAAESFKKFAVKADIVDVELEDADAKTATVINITNKTDKSGGKYIVEKFNGEFSWDLKATNGQILCQAEGYTSKAGVLYSIEKFKKNVEEGTFKCVKDKAGHYCYKLYTAAGRVCAIGESYPSKSSAESAANSVVSFYKLAEVQEIKEEQ